ncbi:MAG: hypothetical protein IE928_05740 [Gammaproteobacteria bacterium]|nr:hypothetical protein [Gammaproteobacteria bacterium]
MSSIFKQLTPIEKARQESAASEVSLQLKERLHRVGERLVAERKLVSAATLVILFALLWLSYEPVNDELALVQHTPPLPNLANTSNIKEVGSSENNPSRLATVSPKPIDVAKSNQRFPTVDGIKLSNANQKAIELALAGKASQATTILEQALLKDPQAGVVFENLRRLYAGFASQSYQLALQPNKPKAITVELASADRTVSVQLDTPKTNNNTAQTKAVASTSPATTYVNQPQPVAESKKETPPAPVEKSLAPSAATPIITPSVNEPTPAQKEAAQRKANQQAIHQALKHWSEAWSKQDVKAYFASYAPRYSPKSSTRKAWMDYRQERILAPKRIKVELSGIKIVLLKPNLARVSFLQSYTSDTLRVRNQKTLELELINNTWLITFESGR